MKLRKRRDVAVHAENGVGGDQFLFIAGTGDQTAQMRRVGMTVTPEFRLGKLTTRIDARMIELVGKNRCIFICKRGNAAEVGGIAGTQDQCAFKPFPCGDFLLQFEHGAVCSGDQTRCAGAGAVATRPLDCAVDEFGTHGKSHIIIGREIKQTSAVDFTFARRDAMHRANGTQTSLCADVVHPRADHCVDGRAHSVRMSL